MIRTKNGSGALDRLAAALRRLRRPVIGRIADGGLTLDLRCLTYEDEFVSVLSELNVDALAG
jgi:L-seryl-tRNA(Ser) seleniumtransferase